MSRRRKPTESSVSAEQYGRVVEQRDEARDDLKAALFNLEHVSREYSRLHDQNEQLSDEVISLRKQLDERDVELSMVRSVPRDGVYARLARSEQARRSLAEQLALVQAANDAMCRDAVTEAGTLAKQAEATS